MSEKKYRLNKWGTRLLKNNRPLFDWANESDNIVNLLNEQEKTIQEYKHLAKIATSLIEWNTIPQVRREWQKHLSKVGDVE